MGPARGRSLERRAVPSTDRVRVYGGGVTTTMRATAGRRDDLSDFLRRHRAALRPADVGLPDTSRRRTPGLRREEVAVLAGVGVSWYTWLEQGRAIGVTTSVLDAIAAVLRLDDDECAYLYRLAGHNPPPPAPTPAGRTPDELRRIVDQWSPNPAYVVDRKWNYLAGNIAARRVLGYTERTRNCLVEFFTDAEFRSRVVDPGSCAQGIVAAFRAGAARYPDDPEFDRIVEELRAASPEFERIWRRHDVRHPTRRTKELRHPSAGELHFRCVALQPVEHPDLRLLLLVPEEESGTAHRLHRLLAG